MDPAFQGTNLVDASAGAMVLFATDEWFACADNLIKNSVSKVLVHIF
jgi:allantoicase